MTERERLIELITQKQQFGTIIHKNQMDDRVCKSIEITNAELADYLIENGVIVPKYNVGDTVWYITGIHRTIVKSAIVEEIIINCNGVSDLLVTSDTGSFENSVDIFYKTKEKAEQALKEREENGTTQIQPDGNSR